ncbi:ABC transporter permease [Streptomyces mirabilis]|uniref:ABC transporter permease n=1 Tax=Streptomyces mirabilis TaxID=68239 RepID=UPI003689E936
MNPTESTMTGQGTTHPNPSADGTPAPQARQHRFSLLPVIERYALVLLLVLLVAVFAVTAPDTFTSANNIRALLQSQSVNAVIAFAVIVPLITGRFDLSVGTTMTLSSMVAAGLMSRDGQNLAVAVLGAVAIGLLAGAVNGFLVARLGVNSLVVTLATATAMSGIIDLYGHGQIISDRLPTALTSLGVTLVGGVPVLFAVMIVAAVLVWFTLTRSPYGRRLTAIGSSEASAVLVGIPVRKVVLVSFLASGVLGAVAGLLQIAAQGSANPTAGGITTMLPALAGAFLGATVFAPGRYNVPGTLVGLFVVAVLVNGMALLGANPSYQPIVNGAAVLVAVSLSTALRRRRLGDASSI